MAASLTNALDLVGDYLQSLQNQICTAIENLEVDVRFQEDRFEKPTQGSGCTRTLSEGAIFEKAGVNFSHVYGKTLPPAATKRHCDLIDASFQAQGISLVLHPRNPYVPTTHANFRFFVAEKPDGKKIFWFGGGYDLTPYYGFVEDCVHWHSIAKAACDRFGLDIYPRLKKACDDYFYLKHRNEPRGIGGLFFDDFVQEDFDSSFEFVKSIGNSFLSAYLPIVLRRKDYGYGEKERDFQNYRRGRYVEFNLIYDRGTLFGLQFGGRVESILVSLPSQVIWRYDWKPEPFTEEARLYNEFLIPKEWI